MARGAHGYEILGAVLEGNEASGRFEDGERLSATQQRERGFVILHFIVTVDCGEGAKILTSPEDISRQMGFVFRTIVVSNTTSGKPQVNVQVVRDMREFADRAQASGGAS